MLTSVAGAMPVEEMIEAAARVLGREHRGGRR
jgi:hypothetical protein